MDEKMTNEVTNRQLQELPKLQVEIYPGAEELTARVSRHPPSQLRMLTECDLASMTDEPRSQE